MFARPSRQPSSELVSGASTTRLKHVHEANRFYEVPRVHRVQTKACAGSTNADLDWLPIYLVLGYHVDVSGFGLPPQLESESKNVGIRRVALRIYLNDGARFRHDLFNK